MTSIDANSLTESFIYLSEDSNNSLLSEDGHFPLNNIDELIRLARIADKENGYDVTENGKEDMRDGANDKERTSFGRDSTNRVINQLNGNTELEMGDSTRLLVQDLTAHNNNTAHSVNTVTPTPNLLLKSALKNNLNLKNATASNARFPMFPPPSSMDFQFQSTPLNNKTSTSHMANVATTLNTEKQQNSTKNNDLKTPIYDKRIEIETSSLPNPSQMNVMTPHQSTPQSQIQYTNGSNEKEQHRAVSVDLNQVANFLQPMVNAELEQFKKTIIEIIKNPEEKNQGSDVAKDVHTPVQTNLTKSLMFEKNSATPTAANIAMNDVDDSVEESHDQRTQDLNEELVKLKAFLATSEVGDKMLTEFYKADPLEGSHQIYSNPQVIARSSTEMLLESSDEENNSDFDTSYIPKSFISKNLSNNNSNLHSLGNSVTLTKDDTKTIGLEAEISKLKEEVQSKDKRIDELEVNLATKEEDISGFEATVDNFKKELETTRHMLSDKETTIDNLGKELETTKQISSDKETNCMNLEKRIDDLVKELQIRDEMNLHLEQQLLARDEDILSLNEELKRTIDKIRAIVGDESTKITAEKIPKLIAKQNSVKLYSKLQMGDVEKLNITESQNIIKNILLQFACSFKSLPASMILASRRVKQDNILLEFVDELHGILYDYTKTKPSDLVLNSEQRRNYNIQLERLNECLDEMLQNVQYLRDDNYSVADN